MLESVLANRRGQRVRRHVTVRALQAPAVLWLAWNASKGTLEPAVILVGGFENPDHSFWGRPVEAVSGPDGALYVSDDTAGAIYRLAPVAGRS